MAPLAVIKTLVGALIVNTVQTHRIAFAAADDGLDRGNNSGSDSLLNETAGDDLEKSSASESGRQTSPFNTSCPYAIPTEDEALSRGGDSSILGNNVHVEGFAYGRTGNRFVELSNALRLGYCCKSKLVTMPPKVRRMAPEIFNGGNPGPRWFDFTSAPDVAGFNSSTCPLDMAWDGQDAYYCSGVGDKAHAYYTPGLKECIQDTPRLLGCEASYFFPADINVCNENELGYRGQREPLDVSPSLEFEVNETIERPFEGGEREAGGHNNLVVHVRSGDIFSRSLQSIYGQPPLQFYIRLINDYEWSRVDFVTKGIEDEYHTINPVVPALESKVAAGELLGDIFFHKDRAFGDDLLSMLCADNLATSVSTVSALTTYHTTASRVFFPKSCATDPYISQGVQQDRPDMKVYGALFDEEEYGPYRSWQNTPEQLTEMIETDFVGFELCVGS